jgi:manganese/zinc/iron transport system permease protein
MSDIVWILVTAFLACAACSIVGLHLILRKQAMLSDALSHSVLPGLVLVFIIFGKLDPIPLFLGAIGVSLTMTLGMEFIRQQRLLREDAAMGLMFSSLFAIGVILLEVFASRVHLDTHCLLYGELAFVPLENRISFAGLSIPESTWQLFWVTGLIGISAFIFHKELILCAFHEEMAQSMGLKVRLIQNLLMMAVAITIMVAFRSLGAILVIAFLVIPGAFGSLLSKNIRGIFIWGSLLMIFSIPTGSYLALKTDNNLAASSISIAFALLLMVVVFQQIFSRKSLRRVH